MSRPAYSTAGEAATAAAEEPELGLQDVELLHLETDDPWAVAEVTGISRDGERGYHTLFILKSDAGWRVMGGGGSLGRHGSTWTLARGEPGSDRRKGLAVFTMAVPDDANELRVRFRRRLLSPRQYTKTVAVADGEAFVVIWDCHFTWGVTRVDAGRGDSWEPLDAWPFRPEPFSRRLAFWRRMRLGRAGWFNYEPRERER